MQILFALTLLVSATLLFIVQPMFAKMALPLLGGSPAVWNTCMVFYQAVLLLGYAYAHISTRWLGPRRQAVLHLGLLCLPWLVLPICIPAGWAPPVAQSPIGWLLLLLTVSVGLPLLLVTASAPLLQAWFADTDHPAAKDPYFLYAASNLGSMVALLGYPVIVEPSLSLWQQSWTWAAVYGSLMLLMTGCAVLLWRQPRRAGGPMLESRPAEPAAEYPSGKVTWRRRLMWLALSMVPSSLLLGVTTHISTDIASVPLLWVIPLALYLLTFTLVFARRTLLPHARMVQLQPMLILPVAACFYLGMIQSAWLTLPLHLAAFFVTAMVCHGRLAALRPDASRLTEFYLWMSVGGVLGGLFNALVAPVVFSTVIEYPLMIVVACLLRPACGTATVSSRARALDLILPAVMASGALCVAVYLCLSGQTPMEAGLWAILCLIGLLCLCFQFQARRVRFALGIGGLMAIGLSQATHAGQILHTERSFFGVVRVEYDSEADLYMLQHGSTNHGMQFHGPEFRHEPLTYYHRTGPLGQVFATLDEEPPVRRIGVIGLGTGSIAAYGHREQEITFYEIDPAVERVARDQQYFTFLSDCPSQIDVVLGDARLRLADVPAGYYDLLILDAFSSDAIPIHLATREALRIYLDKLADEGILMLHISNRFFDLRPLVGRLAEDAGLVCRIQFDPADDVEDARGKYPSCWAILARNEEPLRVWLDDDRWSEAVLRSNSPLWTDDFSNILGVIFW